ncbi:MAG TPA: hypothetical protein PLJ75_03370, partial [Spirochaetota bacterium]|nr:hypothetical protein [Spirochaetota bacterium]
YQQFTSQYNVIVPLLSYYRVYRSDELSQTWYGNPLFWYSSHSTPHDSEYTWWAPIIPLTYHHVRNNYGHRNIVWLLDYSWDEHGLQRLWCLPVFMWGKDLSKATIEHYTVTPLFGRRTVYDTSTQHYTYNNIWFPVIPVYYHSAGDDSSHTNILWLIDWRRNHNALHTLWIVPLLFHEFTDNGYRYYVPLYCSPRRTAYEGVSFGLFHFHRWQPDMDRLWIWLYYHSKHYAINNAPQKNGVEQYYIHFLPIYFSWRNDTSKGNILLPFVYNYSDTNTTVHINLTGYARKTYTGIFKPDVGVNLSQSEGRKYLDTDVSWLYAMWSFSSRIPYSRDKANTGLGDSYLQNADAVDNNKPADYDADSALMKRTIANNHLNGSDTTHPQINKKKTVNREDSQFFWGWKIFFGLMAFEKADSMRHFRLLPLSWLTWDEASKDKLFVLLPLYVSYYSDAEEYFVLFPFYGYQRDNNAFASMYLINCYWHEYDTAGYDEKTILWPFINWYHSDTKRGFRIFPFYWFSVYTEDGYKVTRSFSLIHYNKEYSNNGLIAKSLYINPLYYKSVNTMDKHDDTFAIPLCLMWQHRDDDGQSLFVAGYYRYRSKSYTRDTMLFLYDYKNYYSSGEAIKTQHSLLLTTMTVTTEPEVLRLRLLWGALFEYDRDKNKPMYDVDALLWLVGVEEDNYSFSHKILPLYYYYSEHQFNLLIIPVLLSGCYRHYYKIVDLGLLGLLYYRNEDLLMNDGRRMVLLGTIFDETKKPERKYHSVGSLWGILWAYEKEEETGFTKFSILKGLYKYTEKDGSGKHTFLWFL